MDKKTLLFPLNDDIETFYKLEKSNFTKSEITFEYNTLKTDESVEYNFNSSTIDFCKDDFNEYVFHFTGEVDINPLWRREADQPRLYRRIDESLVPNDAGGFYLKAESNDEKIRQRAYYKIYNNELKNTGGYTFGIDVKTGQDTLIHDVYVRAEIFYLKSVPANYCETVPDQICQLVISAGKNISESFSTPVDISKNIDFIMISICADSFSGNIWFSSPYLLDDCGENYVAPFSYCKPNLDNERWVGENFSKLEWPHFSVNLNGMEIFNDKLYDRIFRWPSFEVNIPKDLIQEGDNTLILRHVKAYDKQPDFLLKDVYIVKSKTEYGVIAYQDIAEKGLYSVLIRTKYPDTVVNSKSDSLEVVPCTCSECFHEAGLNVVGFRVNNIKNGNVNLAIEFDGNIFNVEIKRLVLRENDNIITGSGDSIFINHNYNSFSKYFMWYIYNNIGNLLTMRTSYRWSGNIVRQDSTWEKFELLCKKLEMHYSVMNDGREIIGCNANTEIIDTESPYFKGYQSHEADGAFYYWGYQNIERYDDLYIDIFTKTMQKIGMIPLTMPVKNGDASYRYFDPKYANNMKEATEYFIDNLRPMQKHATRHTGPSVLFKYIFMAGMKWLGAELMYGSLEPVVGALRAASKANGQHSYGAHLAVQWSTTPHDEIYRYRRYFNSLYLCYMHGVDQINTEEGFWRLEEGYSDFERNSIACQEHRVIQSRFFRFIKTHTRRGQIHTPIGFVHGHYDGWTCFGRSQTWMREGDDWEYAAPENSWDLLDVFYPRANLDAIYVHNCPNEPQGFFTGTPFGATDIVPIEATRNVLSEYKTLIFLGWNTADEEQIEKLYDFVEGGGTLLLGWPHLYTTTERIPALEHTSDILLSDKVKNLLGISALNGKKVLEVDEVKVLTGDVTFTTAKSLHEYDTRYENTLFVNNFGKGKVIFVNLFAYPAEKEASKIYRFLLNEIGKEQLMLEKEKGCLFTDQDVSSTIYDTEEMRRIYFMNINWWSDDEPCDKAQFCWGEQSFDLIVKRDTINILTVANTLAVWTFDNETDVISITESDDEYIIKIQGMGRSKIRIFRKNGFPDFTEHTLDLNGPEDIIIKK